MSTERIQISQTGLKCDNPNCDWEDPTVQYEQYKDLVGTKCPKCGEIVLTQEDHEASEEIFHLIKGMNAMSDEEYNEFLAITGIDPKQLANINAIVGESTMKIDTHNGIHLEEITQTYNEPLEKDWPESSSVTKTRYLGKEKILEVTFKSGTYQYQDVPIEVWNEMILSQSVGSFVANSLKGKYKSEKI